MRILFSFFFVCFVGLVGLTFFLLLLTLFFFIYELFFFCRTQFFSFSFSFVLQDSGAGAEVEIKGLLKYLDYGSGRERGARK